MNNLLQLKGRFEQRSNNGRPGPPNIPMRASVQVKHLRKLRDKLSQLLFFWSGERVIDGALISVYYKDVIAKSNRIVSLLSERGQKANSTIVGAKFTSGKIKHIITHYVSISAIETTILNLDKCISILENYYNGTITHDNIERISIIKKVLEANKISKTLFSQIIVDSYYVEDFDIPDNAEDYNENTLVTIYKTNIKTIDLMKKIGIDIVANKILDETTILLLPEQLNLLKTRAPYLIAMSLSDISQLSKDDFITLNNSEDNIIPRPTNEPIIGVIDTLFDERCYFSDWVDYHRMIPQEIETNSYDYQHGTAVSSIIVDGPRINPELDDGCGRFRVKHFGVALARKVSSFTILKNIKEIINTNKDIRVWNLSLGSALEINPNFISPEAAILDKLQYDNNIIFVIAGTNKTNENVDKIGAPADSINAMVVNSVNSRNEAATYSRKGLVLSFFNKPDICYYGGDKNDYIKVCDSCGESLVAGTSYAAPWIARKLSYLIDILGMSREVAKALIIDSAANWQERINPEKAPLIGYGVVPKRIEDIIYSKDDEIKFVIDGVSEKYDTYNYKIPALSDGEKYPYIAKATLCYFPNCSRNQGVDYTNTELDLSFGRITDDGKIKTINDNFQTEEGHYMYEGNARANYRKWDNVKHIIETLKPRTRPKKAYASNSLGISIKTKERLEQRDGIGIRFGLVVTLKEINGVNRIEEFIRRCLLREWLVNKIDVDNKLDIYNKAEEEIVLE